MVSGPPRATRLRGAATIAAAVVLVALAGCNAVLGNEPGELAPAAAPATSGGGAPAAACTVDLDCGPATECETPRCNEGTCSVDRAPAGTVASTQTPGDCRRLECDGDGNLAAEDDETDVYDDGDDCTEDLCNGSTPENHAKAAGEACSSDGGAVCDGNGACVECLGAGGCAGEQLCQASHCVPTACGNAAKDNQETDTDCGGPECAPCIDGGLCVSGADCESGVCKSNVCATPTCTDGVANGSETDIDCGGDCPAKCAPGGGCSANDDCVGSLCTGTTCAPTCSDATIDADETDVDCGGPVCGPCADGSQCAAGADCASGVCAMAICAPAHCFNGAKDGEESGTDCGGACAAKCAFGDTCSKAADCQSGLCTFGHCA